MKKGDMTDGIFLMHIRSAAVLWSNHHPPRRKYGIISHEMEKQWARR